MIDALLIAVRDSIYAANLGGGSGNNVRPAAPTYDYRTCLIMPDGHPPQGCGDVFLAVHAGGNTSDMMNALNEYYGFRLTLTMRCAGIPPDRVGDKLLARNLAQSLGFNNRLHLLKVFLHMNWGVMQDANNVLVNLAGDVDLVYGFAEPAQFTSADDPYLVGGEWFGAPPESENVGLVAEARFERCRRLQAIASYT